MSAGVEAGDGRPADRAAANRLVAVILAGALTGALSLAAWEALRPIAGWERAHAAARVALAIFGGISAALTFASIQRTLLWSRPLRSTLAALPLAWCGSVLIAAAMPERLDRLLTFMGPPSVTFAAAAVLYLNGLQQAANPANPTPPGRPSLANRTVFFLAGMIALYAVFCGFILYAYALPGIGLLGPGAGRFLFGTFAPVPVVALFPVVWFALAYRLPAYSALTFVALSHAIVFGSVLWRAPAFGIAAFPLLSLAACTAAWAYLARRRRSLAVR